MCVCVCGGGGGGGGGRAWYTLFKRALNLNVNLLEICGCDIARIVARRNDIACATQWLLALTPLDLKLQNCLS